LYNNKSAGQHTISWDGKNNEGEKLPSGIWLVRVQVGNQIKSKKVLLLK